MNAALLYAESLEFAQEQLLHARLTAQAALLFFASAQDPDEILIAGETLGQAVRQHKAALLRVYREIQNANTAFPSDS